MYKFSNKKNKKSFSFIENIYQKYNKWFIELIYVFQSQNEIFSYNMKENIRAFFLVQCDVIFIYNFSIYMKCEKNLTSMANSKSFVSISPLWLTSEKFQKKKSCN